MLSLKQWICLSLVFFISPLFASSIPNQTATFKKWVQELRKEALADGIKANTFDKIFAGMTPDQALLHFDRKQPERRITFAKYRQTRGDSYRILLGRRYYQKNKALLEQVGKVYGVSPCVITALWGIESSYGNFMGKFPVLRSLATLAYDTRRSEFFRNELMYALHIVNEGHVQLQDFKGEWAGGTGQPQFLPSSWHKHAVDFDKDGRKDIWGSKGDVFASIANYLVDYGWQTGQAWGVEVTLPPDFNKKLVNLAITKPVQQWYQLGVKLNPNQIKPDLKLQASIVFPLGGPAFMVFNNFKVLMQYNKSTYYAATVAYLADEICQK